MRRPSRPGDCFVVQIRASMSALYSEHEYRWRWRHSAGQRLLWMSSRSTTDPLRLAANRLPRADSEVGYIFASNSLFPP